MQEALSEVQTGIEHLRAPGGDTGYRNDGIWLTLGTLRFHLGQREALNDLEQAIAIDGEDPHPRMMLARCYLHPDFLDPEQAFEEAKNAWLLTRNESEDGRILRLLALACLRQGKLDEADHHAEQAARNDDEEAYDKAICAIVAARQGRRSAAEFHLRSVHDNWPDFNKGGVKVTNAREVLWIDTEEELRALIHQAERALQEAE